MRGGGGPLGRVAPAGELPKRVERAGAHPGVGRGQLGGQAEQRLRPLRVRPGAVGKRGLALLQPAQKRVRRARAGEAVDDLATVVGEHEGRDAAHAEALHQASLRVEIELVRAQSPHPRGHLGRDQRGALHLFAEAAPVGGEIEQDRPLAARRTIDRKGRQTRLPDRLDRGGGLGKGRGQTEAGAERGQQNRTTGETRAHGASGSLPWRTWGQNCS